jgi:Methyltransferase domain
VRTPGGLAVLGLFLPNRETPTDGLWPWLLVMEPPHTATLVHADIRRPLMFGEPGAHRTKAGPSTVKVMRAAVGRPRDNQNGGFSITCLSVLLKARSSVITGMTVKALRRASRIARAVKAVTLHPPYVKPGHFYSPLTTTEDIQRVLSWQDAPGVDLNEKGQIAFARSAQEFLTMPPGPRYNATNNMFGAPDAAVYRAVLHHARPSQVIEVGSGYSTAVALDEAEANLGALQMTCIEPYPARLHSLLRPDDKVTLIAQPVQDVPLATFAGLEAQDILFVDSSHVVKAGSDVAWLLLHVLPTLPPGVLVHVHDVFWPFAYPAVWLAERRDWNEAYFIHAFLSSNADWEILLFSSWLWREHPEFVPSRLARDEPGSLWLRKRR